MNASYYIRKSQVNRKGKTVLMLDITWRGYRLQCSSGEVVEAAQFRPGKGKIVGAGHENSLALNWKLSQLLVTLQREYILAAHEEGVQVEFSVGQMRQLVARLTGQALRLPREKAVPVPEVVVSTEESPWDVYARWQHLSRHKYSAAHLRKWESVRGWVTQYEPQFLLSMLNEQWVDGYVAWLLENTSLGNSSMMTHLSFFRTMLRFQRLPADWLLRPFTENEAEVDLHYEEVLQLRGATYSRPEYRQAADAYVFLCLVGLRYGDYLRVDKLQYLQVQGEEVPVIQLRQSKTKEVVTVPLNELAFTIWQQYEGNPPRFSNQYFNRILKKVGKEAGLNRVVKLTVIRGKDYQEQEHILHTLLTAHTARHTFGSLLLEGSGSKEVAQQGLGHGDSRSTGIYARPKTAHHVKETLAAWEALQQKNNG